MPNIKNPALRERNAQLFFGCSEEEAIALNSGEKFRAKNSYAIKYLSQRYTALSRGICWEINFPEWIEIWKKSGLFSTRGRGKGAYCMARHGNIGPYKIGNVSIQQIEQNSRDGIKVARANDASLGRKRMGHAIGSGRGWTFIENKSKNPYQVFIQKKYIGCYPTSDAATAAYQCAAEGINHKSRPFVTSH